MAVATPRWWSWLQPCKMWKNILHPLKIAVENNEQNDKFYLLEGTSSANMYLRMRYIWKSLDNVQYPCVSRSRVVCGWLSKCLHGIRRITSLPYPVPGHNPWCSVCVFRCLTTNSRCNKERGPLRTVCSRHPNIRVGRSGQRTRHSSPYNWPLPQFRFRY